MPPLHSGGDGRLNYYYGNGNEWCDATGFARAVRCCHDNGTFFEDGCSDDETPVRVNMQPLQAMQYCSQAGVDYDGVAGRLCTTDEGFGHPSTTCNIGTLIPIITNVDCTFLQLDFGTGTGFQNDGDVTSNYYTNASVRGTTALEGRLLAFVDLNDDCPVIGSAESSLWKPILSDGAGGLVVDADMRQSSGSRVTCMLNPEYGYIFPSHMRQWSTSFNMLPAPPPPSSPPPASSCAADITKDLRIDVKNRWAESTQVVFSGQELLYNMTSTIYSKNFGSLYNPVRSSNPSWTLGAYIGDWRWRKCATGSCGSYIQQSQSLNTASLNPPLLTTIESVLRVPKVYVDRRQLYVAYTMRDQYGSPKFARGDLSVGLSIDTVVAGSPQITSTNCPLSSIGNNAGSRWVSYCSASALESAFSTSDASAVLKLSLSHSGQTNMDHSVGGSFAATDNVLTLAATPFWWHSNMRSETTSMTAWPIVNTPSYDIFMTAPTHPVYAQETFEVQFYNYASYSSQKVNAFTFSINYDHTVVDYVQLTQNTHFNSFSVDTSTNGLIVVSTDGASGGDLEGFFWYFSMDFRFKAGTAASSNPSQGTATGIKLFKQTVANSGNNNIGSSSNYASIYDFRSSQGGNVESDSLHMVVEAPSYRAMFLNPDTSQTTVDMGLLYNQRMIDGVSRDFRMAATLVNDNPSVSNHYEAATVASCSAQSSTSSSNYETPVPLSSNMCVVRPTENAGSDVSNSGVTATVSQTCSGTGGSCSASSSFRILSPSSVQIQMSDSTLNLVQPDHGSVSCQAGEYMYQTASVKVMADGRDVTSDATGLHISDTSIANFVVTSSRSVVNNQQDRQHLVQGKMAGSFDLKLFDSPNAPSVALSVSDTPVTVTSIKAEVITDLEWETTPVSSYTPGSTFEASVRARQVLTSRPAGTSRGHYGYLFVTATFSDGASEDVDASEIVPSITSPSVFLIAPGQSDTHTGVSQLQMHNSATDRYMLTLSKNAVSECIQSEVAVNFTRCGSTIGVGYPTVHLQMPNPESIVFHIGTISGQGAYNGRKLTPLNGAAALPPFSTSYTTTTSDFYLEVQFDDATSVTTFASEPDSESTKIVFYTDDVACATVDNAANTFTIVEGATCTDVTLRVNVTIGSAFFQSSSTASVVRMQSVTTGLNSYPSGTSSEVSEADIYPLPCSGTGYERLSLVSRATLTDSHSMVVTAHMTYVSSNTAVIASPGSQSVVQVASSSPSQASSTIGSSISEFNPGSYSDSASITMVSAVVNVYTSQPSSRDYAGTSWNGLPSNTLNGLVNSTTSTSFRLQYTRSDASGTIQFVFNNVMSGYGSWFDYQNMLTFASESDTYISVDAAGTMKLLQNHYQPTRLRSLVCYTGDHSSYSNSAEYDVQSPAAGKDLYANIRPGFGDIDLGVSSAVLSSGNSETLGPYTLTGGQGASYRLYLAANPLSGKYLRGIQLSVTLPSGLSTSSSGSSFVASGDGSSYTSSFNADTNGDQTTFGLSMTHPASIPKHGYMELGYIDLPAPTQSGLLGLISVEIEQMISVNTPTCTDVACSTSQNFYPSRASQAFAYVGTPSLDRRSLLDGEREPLIVPLHVVPSSRRLGSFV